MGVIWGHDDNVCAGWRMVGYSHGHGSSYVGFVCYRGDGSEMGARTIMFVQDG